MSFENLNPLVKKSGSNLSTKEFHHHVNVIFHDIESESYDQIHQDMWENLLEQYKLLTNDFVGKLVANKPLTLMDVGCGTGLGTELVLATNLGEKIKKIILVDVSSKMLEQATKRSKSWSTDVVSFLGPLNEAQEKADLILTSSVLHHIPDLKDFLYEVDRHLNPGGIFMHIHDPNGDYIHHPELLARQKEVADLDSVTNLYQWFNSSPFLKEIFHVLNRWRGKKNHIDRVNETLLQQGVIKKRLSAKEIWSITDIHVEGLPYSTQKGISFQEISKLLPQYQSVGLRSYGFFGRLGVELPTEYQIKEQELIRKDAKEGRYLAAAWQKKNSDNGDSSSLIS